MEYFFLTTEIVVPYNPATILDREQGNLILCFSDLEQKLAKGMGTRVVDDQITSTICFRRSS